jgi:hypothetical protein
MYCSSLCLTGLEPLLVFNVNASSSPWTFDFHFDEPMLQEITVDNKTFTQVSMTNCLSQATPGHPSLPVYPLRVVLPQHQTVTSIDVIYQSPVKLSHDFSTKPVIPQQNPFFIEDPQENHSFLMNTSLYNSTGPVFDSMYRNGGIWYLRGFAIQTLYLYPVQYLPGTGDAYYFPSMKVNLHLTNTYGILQSSGEEFFRGNPEDITMLTSLVINPEVTSTYQTSPYSTLVSGGLCDPEETFEYVIVTNEALNDTMGYAYNWSDLLTRRSILYGWNTTKITVERISACSSYWSDDPLFNDSATQLREFIKDAYHNWNTQYVVLGGDWDTANPDNQIVPARIFTEYNSYLNGDDYYTVPCDLYFSNLDGDWWDTQHNCWGGGQNSGVNDPYAEVFVGRMTVSTPQELSNFIGKILWYDGMSDDEFAKKAVFFGGNLGWSVSSADYMEEIRNGDNPHFYQCEGFVDWNTEHPDYAFDIDTRKYSSWGDPIPSSFQTIINNNEASIINHMGHGTTTCALDMTAAQLRSLSNTYFFFAYSAQCLSGRFTAGDTTEKILTCENSSNGAFALIWNTGYGWGSMIDTNGSSHYLQRQFWDYLFTTGRENWTIGAAQFYAKDQMSCYVALPDWHYCWAYSWYSSTLFGDPAQRLKVKATDEPIRITDESPVNCSSNTMVGNVTLQCRVTDPEGHSMNCTMWTNATGSWVPLGITTLNQTGVITHISYFPAYNTTYWWRVNVTDLQGTSGWTNATFSFTTRPIHIVTAPTHFSAIACNKTMITLTWDKGENATHTRIERHSIPMWSRGAGAMIYNGTGDSWNDTGLLPETTSYYQAWSWDTIDAVWSLENSSTENTTCNRFPQLFNASPNNTSGEQDINPILRISVYDIDNDPLNLSFFSNATGQWMLLQSYENISSGNHSLNTSCFSNYSTVYWWRVNLSDGQSFVQDTMWFATRPNQPPVLLQVTPSNGSTDISVSTACVSILINDSEDDRFSWSIDTIPDVGQSSSCIASSGVKFCYLSGLTYETTYYWIVRCKDNGSGKWTNATFFFTTEEHVISGQTQGGTPPSSPPLPSLEEEPIVEQEENTPPETTTGPVGAQYVELGVLYEYSCMPYDPNGDMLRVQFDWGDGQMSPWSEYVDSNSSVKRSHSWDEGSVFEIKVRAQDKHGANSSWSAPLMVTVSQTTEVETNISQDSREFYGRENEPFTFNGTEFLKGDLQGMDYVYEWDFGDDMTEYGCSPVHVYNQPGTYTVTIFLYDTTGSLVNKTTFSVTIKPQSMVSPIDSNSQKDNEAYYAGGLLLPFFGAGGFLVLIVILCWRLFIAKRKHR